MNECDSAARDANFQFSEATKFDPERKFWKLCAPDESKCIIIK